MGSLVDQPEAALTKPDIPEITAQDWEHTPLAVKRYVKHLESRIN
jgi:hypothetical protein